MERIEYKPNKLNGYPHYVLFNNGGLELAPLFSWLDKNTDGWCVQYPYVYFAKKEDAIRFSLTYGNVYDHGF